MAPVLEVASVTMMSEVIELPSVAHTSTLPPSSITVSADGTDTRTSINVNKKDVTFLDLVLPS